MLKIEHLKKTYPKSDRLAVNDISFELQPGEIFGFLGQNGAGKSTTIKCLTGILPFDSGTIARLSIAAGGLYTYVEFSQKKTK